MEYGVCGVDTDALVNELEPYYKSTDLKRNALYSFRDGEASYYEFTVHRENSFEFIVVKKYSSQN